MQYDKYLFILLLWLCYFRAGSGYSLNPQQENNSIDYKNSTEDDENGTNRSKRQVVKDGNSNNENQEVNNETPEEPEPRPKSNKFTEQEVISAVLNKYDYRVRARGTNSSNTDTGGPVVVTVNFLLRSISKIDDVNMEYSTQFTFREEWVDERLAYEKIVPQNREKPLFVVLAPGQLIWMPDTFFQNEKEARKHEIDKPNVLIRIYPNGKILYSVRLSLVLSCPMQLEYYPLDHQKCLIELASYAYTTEDIVYLWKDTEPVQKKKGLERSLPSFELQDIETGYCTSSTATGEYSCLRISLNLRREFSYYLLQLYIPSFMLVIVSWVSFWLDKDSVPARVTLGVTTLLTMTTQSSGINAKLPPVSYTKAIDVWIGVCLAFIFGALLEFALVNYAARKDIMHNVSVASRRNRKPQPQQQTAVVPAMSMQQSHGDIEMGSGQHQHHQEMQQQQQQNEYNSFIMNPLFHPNVMNQHNFHQHTSLSQHQLLVLGNNSNRPMLQQSSSTKVQPQQQQQQQPMQVHKTIHAVSQHKTRGCLDSWLFKYKERSKRIDVVSRLVFPVGFFIFNCVYWSVYMTNNGGKG